MTTTQAQLIQYIRVNAQIKHPVEPPAVEEPKFLYLSDDELSLYLQVVLSRDFSDYPDFSSLPPEAVYPLLLLIKREIYYTYATRNATYIDMGADNNNYLKRSQIFAHYMKLIAQVNEELKDFEENGGLNGSTLYSSDLYLSNRQYTNRTHNLVPIPKVKVSVGEVTTTSIEVYWTSNASSHFAWYKVYLSDSPIFDDYVKDKGVSREGVTLLTTNIDFKQNTLRIEGLEPDTQYYVLVAATVTSANTGYFELGVYTESEFVEPDEPEDNGDNEVGEEEGAP